MTEEAKKWARSPKVRRSVSLAPQDFKALTEVAEFMREPLTAVVSRLVRAEAHRRGVEMATHAEAKAWVLDRMIEPKTPPNACELCNELRLAVGKCNVCGYTLCSAHMAECRKECGRRC